MREILPEVTGIPGEALEMDIDTCYSDGGNGVDLGVGMDISNNNLDGNGVSNKY